MFFYETGEHSRLHTPASRWHRKTKRPEFSKSALWRLRTRLGSPHLISPLSHYPPGDIIRPLYYYYSRYLCSHGRSCCEYLWPSVVTSWAGFKSMQYFKLWWFTIDSIEVISTDTDRGRRRLVYFGSSFFDRLILVCNKALSELLFSHSSVIYCSL